MRAVAPACAFAGLGLAFLPLAATGEEASPAPPSEAQPPGESGEEPELEKMELRILCWEGYANKAWVKGVQAIAKEKHGVDLTVTPTYAEEYTEFYTAARRLEHDLISPSHDIMQAAQGFLMEKGLTLPMNLENVPHFKDLLGFMKEAEFVVKDGKVYGVPLAYGAYSLAYNADLVEKAPTSWKVLWDERYKGKYAINKDDGSLSVYVAALVAGIGRDKIANYDTLKSSEVTKMLEPLISNAKSLWVGVDTPEALKDCHIATTWGDSIPDLIEQGQNWKIAQPVEGSVGWIDLWVITAALAGKPKLKQIAEEWINFTISPEVQLGNMRDDFNYPVNTKVKELATEEEVRQFKLDDPDYFNKAFIPSPTANARDENGIIQMWKKALVTAGVESEEEEKESEE